MAKITYQNDTHDQDISIKLSDGADVTEFFETMQKLFICIGYHPQNWKDIISEYAEEYEIEKDE